MRVVVQRVSEASVTVDGERIGDIGRGFLVLAGFTGRDTPDTGRWMAEKIVSLRLFPDDDGRMNRSLREVDGAVLAVSQFTLYGDVQKGRRPSFVHAAPPEIAIPLYEQFIAALRATGVPVETGRFGAEMDVRLVNWGPVTLVVER